MKSKKSLIPLGIIIGGAVLASLWHLKSSRAETKTHAVIVCDRSKSTRDACLSTLGLSEQAMELPGLNSLLVLATGDAASGNEPIPIAHFKVPSQRRVMEGRKAEKRRRMQLLTNIYQRCLELPKVKTSQIFLAVERSLEHLRAQGCGKDKLCYLYVQSDLAESSEKTIRKIQRGKKKVSQAQRLLLFNIGIDTHFCGYSQTMGQSENRHILTQPRSPRRGRWLIRGWATAFTERELLHFSPLCPRPSDSLLRQIRPMKGKLEEKK